MLQEVRRLYDEEAQRLGGAVPGVLLAQNRDCICSAVLHALGSPPAAGTVSATVRLDMLRICNESPQLANTLVADHSRGVGLVRDWLTCLVSAVLRRLGVSAARASDMDMLSGFYFQITSMFSCSTECLGRFYAKIDERIVFVQAGSSTARRGRCGAALVLFEACVEPSGRERHSSTRVHRCENPMCRDGEYVIEKEVRDMHAGDAGCGDASAAQERYVSRSTSQYLVVDSSNCIKMVLDGPKSSLRCSNCRLVLGERMCSTSTVFRYNYVLQDSAASVRGHSYFPIEARRCVLVGRIVRGAGLRPELCILGVFTRAEKSTARMGRGGDTVSALRSMYRSTHSMFFSNEETHYTLLVILSMFAVGAPKVVVYTNEVSYVRHYAVNYFIAFGLEVHVELELGGTESRAGVLFVRPDTDSGHRCSAADFVFHVRVENADIDYRYESAAGGRRWELCSAAQVGEHALPHIQKAFLSLRAFFREAVSPPRLLSYVHTLVSGLAHVTRQDVSPADVRLVETLLRSAVVPDVGRHACAGSKRACTGARQRLSDTAGTLGQRCWRA